jgi:hypothetical protein
MTQSGLPSYFRGRAFNQWPQEKTQGWYTPQQMQLFEEMNRYLQGQ